MDYDKLKYTVKETARQKGAKWFFWRGLLVLVALWLFWPDMTPPPQPEKPEVSDATDDATLPKPWHQTAEVERDLRQILTTTQSSFYWDSFNWMMEYGKPLTPRSFESKILNLLYVMDEGEKADNGMFCRTFREKLVVAGQANTREGLACQRGKADWCKQLKGEKMQCRTQHAQGLQALTDEMLDTHNFEIRLKRGLYKLPRF